MTPAEKEQLYQILDNLLWNPDDNKDMLISIILDAQTAIQILLEEGK